MSVKVVRAQTRIEAWLDGVEHVLTDGVHLNLILEISEPLREPPGAVRSLLDEFYRAEEELPLHSVAETIFPGWQYRRRGMEGLITYYAEEFDALKEPHSWGSYADRLLRRTTEKGDTVSPLAVLIDKMRSELNYSGTKRACYEIGIAEPAYDWPLYDTVADQGRRLGAPCLSHLSFKLVHGAVHLTALYRSHDYRRKVPGNLLGLARLQACVAHETGTDTGSLVVHSTYAWAEGSKRTLRRLIGDVRTAIEAGQQ